MKGALHMKKLAIVYWSGTGNTERMAELIKEGAEAQGAEVGFFQVGQINSDKALEYDAIALGSPSMGAEVIEETEMEPFVEEISGRISGKTIGLFGSYGWGDGEWMREWVKRMDDQGAMLIDDGLIVNEMPQGEDEERCKEFGKSLVK